MSTVISKKGDLELVILEARDLTTVDGKKAHNTYCVIDLNGNKTQQTQVLKDSEPKWNQSFNLDLMHLDDEELLIQVFAKRTLFNDKFLGQIQIKIKALSLSKEPAWHFLTDKPRALPDELKSPDGMKKNASEIYKTASKKKPEKEKATVVSGELKIQLTFVHRLLRSKTRGHLAHEGSFNRSGHLTVDPKLLASVSSQPSSPGVRASLPLPASANGAGGDASARPSLRYTNSRNSLTAAPLSPGGLSPHLTQSQVIAIEEENPSKNEAIIIEEALKQKQILVHQKLQEQRDLARVMSMRVASPEEQKNLDTLQNEIKMMEQALASSKETPKPESTSPKVARGVSQRNIGRGVSTRRLQRTETRKNTSLVRFKDDDLPPRRSTFATQSEVLTTEALRPIANTGVSVGANKRMGMKWAEEEKFATPQEEIKFLRLKLQVLESNLEDSRQVNDMAAHKVGMLEKEVRRLERELDREKQEREREERLREREARLLELERAAERRAGGGGGGGGGGGFSGPILESDQLAAFTKINVELSDLDKERDAHLTLRRNDAAKKLKEIEQKIGYATLKRKELEVDVIEKRVKRREEHLERIEKKIGDPASDEDDDSEDDESDSFDDDESGDSGSESARGKRSTPRPPALEQFDKIVSKLEKLDKLDELLRKLDNMKVVGGGGGGGGGGGSGRGYAELKAELEELQKIIFDETNKYNEKEKEDANIKYEKVSKDLAQTDEYKKEVAAALEEKRKKNEPLNKEALEKMRKVYTADSILNNKEVKEKVLKNPELVLITMEPKAILSKHQNDFTQYLLRNLDVDELRAIRGACPKFRSDQQKQIDWLEGLENKIDVAAAAPAKKPPPPKPTGPPKFKPKPAAKAGAPPGDMFAELLAKRKKVDDAAGGGGGGEPAPAEEKKDDDLKAIKKLPIKTPSSKGSPLVASPSAPIPPPPPGMAPKPPPPPPPMFSM